MQCGQGQGAGVEDVFFEEGIAKPRRLTSPAKHKHRSARLGKSSLEGAPVLEFHVPV